MRSNFIPILVSLITALMMTQASASTLATFAAYHYDGSSIDAKAPQEPTQEVGVLFIANYDITGIESLQAIETERTTIEVISNNSYGLPKKHKLSTTGHPIKYKDRPAW